jgi:hypothetical protein
MNDAFGVHTGLDGTFGVHAGKRDAFGFRVGRRSERFGRGGPTPIVLVQISMAEGTVSMRGLAK